MEIFLCWCCSGLFFLSCFYRFVCCLWFLGICSYLYLDVSLLLSIQHVQSPCSSASRLHVLLHPFLSSSWLAGPWGLDILCLTCRVLGFSLLACFLLHLSLQACQAHSQPNLLSGFLSLNLYLYPHPIQETVTQKYIRLLCCILFPSSPGFLFSLKLSAVLFAEHKDWTPLGF